MTEYRDRTIGVGEKLEAVESGCVPIQKTKRPTSTVTCQEIGTDVSF